MGIAISTHLPPPVMIESTEVRRWVTHMLCWSCGMYFSAAASSEKDHGSMNLDSKTAPVPSTVPSRVATIQGIAECLTRRWTSVTRRPVLRSYQERLSSSVAAPSCTMRFPDRSSGSASPRFSRQRRTRAVSSAPMMIRASEPPMNERRFQLEASLLGITTPLPWNFGRRHATVVSNAHVTITQSYACDKCTDTDGQSRLELDCAGPGRSDRASPKYNQQYRSRQVCRRPRESCRN